MIFEEGTFSKDKRRGKQNGEERIRKRRKRKLTIYIFKLLSKKIFYVRNNKQNLKANDKLGKP